MPADPTTNHFDVEYTCIPAKVDRQLNALAEEYRSRTGAFDVLVCGGDGTPCNARQHGLINRHAEAVIRELTERSGYTEHEIRKAIRNDWRHRYA